MLLKEILPMFDEYDPVLRNWFKQAEYERRQRQYFEQSYEPSYVDWIRRYEDYCLRRVDDEDMITETTKKKDYNKEIDVMIKELKAAGFNCRAYEPTYGEKKVDIKTRDKELKLGTATFDKGFGNHKFEAVKELQLRFLCGIEDEKILKTEYILNGNTTYTKFKNFLEHLNKLEMQYKLGSARIKKMEATMDFV